jgi:type VI protein secretion system component VasK
MVPLLRWLRRHHEHEPINGLLVTVAADSLASQTEEAPRTRAACERIERCGTSGVSSRFT